MAFNKAVALEIIVAKSKKTSENPDCPVELQVVLEIYNSYFSNENLSQKSSLC